MERIGAAEEILHEDAAQSGVGEEILLQPGEAFRGHGGGVVPPHGLRRSGIAHDEFVIGTAPGMGAGRDDEGAAICDHPPGAAPRSTTTMPRRKIRDFSSISRILKAARER